MHKVISDCLVQDPLPSDYFSLLIYDMDSSQKYFYIKDDGVISESITHSRQGMTTIIPMIELDSKWKTSLRQEPKNLKSNLNLLLKVISEDSSNNFEAESFKAALSLANLLLLKETKGCNIVFASTQCMKNNAKDIVDLSYERNFVQVDWLPDNKMVFLPDPEWIGALPIKNNTFGGFGMSTYIINVTLK